MDPALLEQKGVEPRNARIAVAENYELRIGNKATLLRAAGTGKQAHGIVYSLTHGEIHSLYWGAGLNDYASEAIMVRIGGESIPVLCCNLIEPPAEHESNAEYEGNLKGTMSRLGVPSGQFMR